jgi:hypothetical protein
MCYNSVHIYTVASWQVDKNLKRIFRVSLSCKVRHLEFGEIIDRGKGKHGNTLRAQ